MHNLFCGFYTKHGMRKVTNDAGNENKMRWGGAGEGGEEVMGVVRREVMVMIINRKREN